MIKEQRKINGKDMTCKNVLICSSDYKIIIRIIFKNIFIFININEIS
jgi:hypothetical protein